MEFPFAVKARLLAFVCLALASTVAHGQCDIFKSEITDVKDYELTVSQLTDSLKPHVEAAAFAARFTEGRTSARLARDIAGQALAAAEEAVKMASEAQYQAELCGTSAVITFSINAESAAVDARDLADEIYTNAKKASAARSLGDIHYYMRKALMAAREAQKRADASAYAAYDAYHSCKHRDGVAAGRGR